MKRTLFLLWVCMGALYAANTSGLFSSETPAPRPADSAVAVLDSSKPRTVSVQYSDMAPIATGSPISGEAESDGVTRETKTEVASTELTKLTGLNGDDYEWSQLSHSAFVHNGPAISSPLVGYYPAGTELRILGREGGWVKILHPSRLKEGWIYEIYATPLERPNVSDELPVRRPTKLIEEAALAVPSATDTVPQQRTPNFHRKKEASYPGRRRPARALRFAFRFRGFRR
jgi:hypothetical protein